MPSISGGGGGLAAGSYLPVANKTGVTVDATTYSDALAGGGAKLTTLVFPAEQGVLAFAITGDAFPRLLVGANPADYGLLMWGDGTVEPTNSGSALGYSTGGGLPYSVLSGDNGVSISTPKRTFHAARVDTLSPKFTITSGALPTVQLISTTGVQISASRDAETVTPFTGDGTNNAATCAIAISPDNVTYSTVATISIAAALNLTGVLTDTVNARVPAGWYLKLTVSHGTLGLTSWY